MAQSNYLVMTKKEKKAYDLFLKFLTISGLDLENFERVIDQRLEEFSKTVDEKLKRIEVNTANRVIEGNQELSKQFQTYFSKGAKIDESI